MAPEDWVGPQPLQPISPDTMTLFCFPSAGGGAPIFREWQKLSPATVRPVLVQLPGRENRWEEPAYTDLTELRPRQ